MSPRKQRLGLDGLRPGTVVSTYGESRPIFDHLRIRFALPCEWHVGCFGMESPLLVESVEETSNDRRAHAHDRRRTPPGAGRVPRNAWAPADGTAATPPVGARCRVL